MNTKGWIALDIDGTITLDKYSVPQQVVAFLRSLSLDGWQIVLATGRPLAFASLALRSFDFPYLFLAQNGSLALEMPAQTVLFKKYISAQEIPLLESAYEGIDSDFLIYAGYEKGDFCYWRPHRFSSDELAYIAEIQNRQKERWEAIESFAHLPIGQFPLVKCFGSEGRMNKVAERLRETGRFQVAKIRDPFTDYFLLLVTDRLASKGSSLQQLFTLKGRNGPVIAAGDDENDLSLLAAADIKIAMSHAPAVLQQAADMIAPPTQQQGIIQALQMAMRKL